MKKIYFILISMFIFVMVFTLFIAPIQLSANGASDYTYGVPGDYPTIAAAVAQAAAMFGSGANTITINIAPGTYYEHSILIGLAASKTLYINGSGASSTTVNGSATDAVFYISGAGTVVIRNLTITDGEFAQGGGINSTISQLELYNCYITNNHATSSGGGLYCTNTVIIDDCNISNNLAASGYMGGGIYCFDGTLTITDSIISNNTAGEGTTPGDIGGGIYFINGTLDIYNCSITNNQIKPDSGSSYNGVYIGSTLNATMNWWGSSTGPYQDPLNVGGQGNSIIGIGLLLSDFYPWLTSDPFATGTIVEPVWIRTIPMTCYKVWINEDNKFQFIFWYPYRDNNWVKIYDMSGKEVYSMDMPYDNPNLIVDLPDGMYTVKTFTVGSTEPIQEFVIGKP